MRFVVRLAALAALGALAAPPASAAPRPTVIKDITVIDGTGAAPRAHMDVVIRDGRIVSVRPTGPSLPKGLARIDGRGKFLMPGMMDIHIHLVGGALSWGKAGGGFDDKAGARALQGYLYAGFTTVYDSGNHPDFIYKFREQERRGEIASPRIFATGYYVTAPDGWGARPGAARLGVPAATWPEAREELDAQIALRPDLQKFVYEEGGIGPNPMIPVLAKPVMKAMIDYLHARGIRTTVHASNEMAARDAIEAGIDAFAHTPPEGVLTPAFVKLVADRKLPFATTMTVFDEIVQLGEGTDYLEGDDYVALMEPQYLKDRVAARDVYVRTGWPTWFKAIQPYLNRNVKALSDGGAVLALGTDKSFAPLALRELELLEAAGIAPLQIIRIATLNGAAYLGKSDDLGSVEPGKAADLLILSADPSQKIMNVRSVQTVIKGGEVIDRGALDLPVNRLQRLSRR